MKRDSASVEREPQALAAFKAMDKGSSSLPFPPSVLLTKPLGASLDDDLPTQATNDESPNAAVSLPSLTEFIDSYVKPHIPQPYAPQSSPRTSRAPATPTSVPHSPSMRSSIYDEHHHGYSTREHPSQTLKYQQPQHSQPSYHQQQYIQQYQHIREQQMHDHHMFDQREIMQYREYQFQEQQLSKGILRDQHARDQQYELQEQLREQQQRLMSPYHYDQHAGDHTQRRGTSELPFSKVKREPPVEYNQYSEPRLSVREQLKLNLLQREPGQNDPHERGNYMRSASKGPPPPSPLTTSNGVKHSGGFTQHMFAVPTSPSSSSPLSPTSYVPSGSSKQGYGNSTPTHFDSTKFTNYTSQEFQYLSNKTHITSSSLVSSSPSQNSSPSILAGSSGKWTAWENDKDVYKQAKLLSESLQCNVKSYLEATNTTSPRALVPGTPPTPSTPSSPSLSIQRTPGATVPSLSISPPSTISPSPRASPRASSLQSSAGTKRKASLDNTIPPKVQATSAQQHEYQKEAQLFSSKDISAGMHRFNTLLSNANMLDIYNKFNRPDEYAQYHTKSHRTPSTTPPSISTPSTSQ